MPRLSAIIASLITDHPMCRDCIASKASIESPVALNEALKKVGEALLIHQEHGRCRSCGVTSPIVWINRPE